MGACTVKLKRSLRPVKFKAALIAFCATDGCDRSPSIFYSENGLESSRLEAVRMERRGVERHTVSTGTQQVLDEFLSPTGVARRDVGHCYKAGVSIR